jgi:alpha-mannosidase
LRFPVNLNFMRATYETPYGHIQRFANGEEEPGQSWIDLSGVSRDTGDLYGLSILNDGKYSFDVNVRDIGLTVLRSPVYANHLPVIPQADGHYAFLDQGIQHFTYSLLPHSGSWEEAGTVRRAAELNRPPLALITTYHPHGTLPQRDSYLSIDAENIVISVVKQAEEGDDMVLRAYETAGMATDCIMRLGALLGGRTIEAAFRPCEIKTLRIPRDNAAPVVETNMLEWAD